MERARSVVSDVLAQPRDEISADIVQQTLAEIFQSTPFRASKQSQDLLRYIVDHSISGHGEQLKERLIGVNVFRRPLDYDTNEDPIVRARAAEVRKRLAQFYLGEGSQSQLRIEIAPGSYHASFAYVRDKAAMETVPAAAIQAPSLPSVAEPAIPIAVSNKTLDTATPRRRIAVIPVATIAVLCLAVWVWFLAKPEAPLDRFWKPFFDTQGSVVLYSGANAVYMLSPEFMNRYKATHHLDQLENQGREFAVPLSPGMKLGAEDLVPFTNEFITIGDLSANVRLASLLAKHRKRFDLRCGGDVAFSDLRQSPAILIGAFNNSWTMELTGDLPFALQHAAKMTITDQTNHAVAWTPIYSSDNKISVDYAVVTRMPHSKTGQALVTIAGMTQAGTHAAADFITDPEQLNKLAAVIPKDWDQKNLQFVLQTKVVDNIPTAPVLVATKSW